MRFSPTVRGLPSARSADRRGHLPAGHRRPRGIGDWGLGLPEHRRAATTGTRWPTAPGAGALVIPLLEKSRHRDGAGGVGPDWSEIDPSILETLFERGLDPGKRAQLGAHYMDRDKIMLLVEPVVIRPLLVEWNAEKTAIIGSARTSSRRPCYCPRRGRSPPRDQGFYG